MAQGEYVMPAEWEPHAGCWMGWPYRRDTWHSDARPAQQAYAAVASAIARFEPVTVCATAEYWEEAREMLPPEVRVVEMGLNDAWFRDQAPIFVKHTERGDIVGLDWGFNAWGEYCYRDWSLDSLVPRKICQLERIAVVDCTTTILEGGSIHVDGQGTILTTEECLLKPNAIGKLRNPGKNKREIELTLCQRLGAQKVLWLPQGAAHDLDTNGHIDNIACFLRPGVIALLWAEPDENSEQHARSAAALTYLQSETDAREQPVHVVKILAPRPMKRRPEECRGLVGAPDALAQPGDAMPGSYINFYIANGGVIVPQFGDAERDVQALAVLKQEFPTRQVVGVASREVLCGGGNIHCITMQQPLGEPIVSSPL